MKMGEEDTKKGSFKNLQRVAFCTWEQEGQVELEMSDILWDLVPIECKVKQNFGKGPELLLLEKKTLALWKRVFFKKKKTFKHQISVL